MSLGLVLKMSGKPIDGKVFNAQLKEEFDKLMDEPDGLRKFHEELSKSMTTETLGLIVADHVFGDELDSNNEHLFLKHQLDETENIQAELINRVDQTLEQNGILEPDAYILHVYNRKTGMKFPQLPYKFCSLMVLDGFQCFNVEPRHRQMISTGQMTKVFDMAKFIPSVPKDLTIVDRGNGKSTIKNKKYRSIVLWLFWTEYPVQTKMDTKAMEDQLKKLISEESQKAGLGELIKELPVPAGFEL